MPIVGDLEQRAAMRYAQPDLRGLGIGVLDDVLQRFLGHPVQGGLDVSGKAARRRVDVDRDARVECARLSRLSASPKSSRTGGRSPAIAERASASDASASGCAFSIWPSAPSPPARSRSRAADRRKIIPTMRWLIPSLISPAILRRSDSCSSTICSVNRASAASRSANRRCSSTFSITPAIRPATERRSSHPNRGTPADPAYGR